MENTNSQQLGAKYENDNAKQLKNSRKVRSKKYLAYTETANGRPHSVERNFKSIGNNPVQSKTPAIITDNNENIKKIKRKRV